MVFVMVVRNLLLIKRGIVWECLGWLTCWPGIASLWSNIRLKITVRAAFNNRWGFIIFIRCASLLFVICLVLHFFFLFIVLFFIIEFSISKYVCFLFILVINLNLFYHNYQKVNTYYIFFFMYITFLLIIQIFYVNKLYILLFWDIKDWYHKLIEVIKLKNQKLKYYKHLHL